MIEVCQENEKLWSNKCDLNSNKQKPDGSLYKRLSWNVIETASKEMSMRPVHVSCCNEHGTFYAISSDFGDRMTIQHLD